MKTLLVPIDFSAITARVIDEAVTLARALDGRIVLLHVTEPVAKLVDVAVIVVSIADVDTAAAKEAGRRLNELAEQLKTGGVAAEALQLTGSPVPEIVGQAKSLRADFIVMGSHGHTAFYDLVAGSTTHGVLKRAECPVMIVTATPTDRERAVH